MGNLARISLLSVKIAEERQQQKAIPLQWRPGCSNSWNEDEKHRQQFVAARSLLQFVPILSCQKRRNDESR
jgi:hypothetical protein